MKFKKALLIGIDEAKLDPVFWKRLDSLVEKRVYLAKDSADIKKELVDTDCLLVAFETKVDKNDVDSAPNLRYIGTLSVACGKVDAEYAKSRDIPVCNLAGYCTDSVAEFILAAILEHIRELETGKKRGRAGNYSEDGLKVTEIKNKVFGILGLGSIGKRVSEIAIGFGADVHYWSRNRKKDFEAKGVKYEEADVLIPKCDFLSLNFAQTEDTEKFLDEGRIAKLKKGVVVINTASMELVDVDALDKRLKNRDMTFILDHSDVMNKEDLKKLSKHTNCIIYPPMAYISKEARIAKQEIFISNMENFLKGTPTNRVN